ncbi:MAG: DEAD/DEAH box helicase family protein, partial [Oscillospiraceae bacterium]
KTLCEIRISLREVIDLQLNDYQGFELEVLQDNLNKAYDNFVDKYSYIHEQSNQRAFKEDTDLPLLLSIEDKNKEDGYDKAKIFTEATIKPKENFVPSTYEDLIILSMAVKGKLDIPFMAKQFNVEPIEVITNLKGNIYVNPAKISEDRLHSFEEIYTLHTNHLDDIEVINQAMIKQLVDIDCFETSDEYLTGNVKSKLEYVNLKTIQMPYLVDLFADNIKSLQDVQPTPLTIDEINYRLGATWIDTQHYRDFMYDIADVPFYARAKGDVENTQTICLIFNKYTGEYTIYGKGLYNGVNVTSTYGTERRNFFTILEDTLNLKESRVYDSIIVDGKERQVLNPKETQLARQKQEIIKNEFKNYIVENSKKCEDIVKTYNSKFNVYRNRQFDGSNIEIDGMTKDITLRPHQNDAIARILYSGKNALIAHVVGAGKTFTMVASAIELKRLGIANKSLFVVPNHLLEQWGSDFFRLYPNSNILVATKKDFEPQNRKEFISKMATGDYDAIIIGHSQFEKIPMSDKFIENEVKEQINELEMAIQSLEKENGKRFTVKRLEQNKKSLVSKLKNLNAKPKDDVITFEQTGVDYVFVDEAHNYKNCFVFTKMSNVAGVSTSASQKSFDMLMKTKYITNKNSGRGVVFATGTPISNSMTEMFVMQRYLQADTLQTAGLSFFDDWASTFGETVTGLEIKPEGTGYRMKTRFAKFNNLPELITMFHQVADVKVADDLNLPTPNMVSGKAIIETCEPSPFVKSYIESLVPRSESIRNGSVDSSVDNMLKITNEGRIVAFDGREIDPYTPVDYNSKIYKCCDNVEKLYKNNMDTKACQLIFLDFSTPTSKDGYLIKNYTNGYDEIKKTLVDKGIPADEIEFIHTAKTDVQKANLFEKCRNGQVRVLLGSTSKCGAGTNIQ